MEEEEGEGMGDICLGRVRARNPLFLRDETEPRNTHSHHQQYTSFVPSSSQHMHHHLPPLHHANAHSHHTHSHHAHSHSLPKGLDRQAVNLMELPPYDPLPPQNQAQQVQLPSPSHVSPTFAAHEVKGVDNQ